MIIIWGSRYLGRKDLRHHLGTCRNCGHTGKLADYVTRQWFTLYFIPIFPMGSKQVVNHCPACKARYEVGREDYRRARRDGHGQTPMELEVTAAVAGGDLDRAARQLAAAGEARQTGSADTPLALIRAHQGRQEHNKALEVAQMAMRQQPDLARDKEFRQVVAISERAGGGGGQVLPKIPLLDRRPVRWALVAAAVLLVGYAIGFYMSTHRKVYVVNGLPGDVKVAIDGDEAVRVAGGERDSIRIGEGAHEAVVTDAAGRTEKFTFEIADSSFFSRFADDHVFVLNPFGAAVVLWETTGYAENVATVADKHTYKVHLGEHLMTFDDIDYEFKDFPEEIQMPEQTKIVYKTRLSVVSGEPTAMLAAYMDTTGAKPAHCLAYAEAHLGADPDKPTLLAFYAALGLRGGDLDRCRSFIEGRLNDRPVRVAWHRWHQTLAQQSGGGAGLVDTYRALLASDPRNPDLLYLLGRLQGRVSESLQYMDRALAIDQSHPYALMSRAYHYLATARFVEAEIASRQAAKRMPDDPEFSAHLGPARMALRKYSEIESECLRNLKDNALSLGAHVDLLAVLVASGRGSQARRTQRAYESGVQRELAGDPGQLGLRSQLALSDLEGDFNAVLANVDRLRDESERTGRKFMALLAGGRSTEAAALPGIDQDADSAILTAISLHADGKTTAADQWRGKVRALLAAGDADDQAWGALLASGAGVDPTVALDTVAPYDRKCPLLVLLVQNGADRKLLEMAEKLNFGVGSRCEVIKRAIRKLRWDR